MQTLSSPTLLPKVSGSHSDSFNALFQILTPNPLSIIMAEGELKQKVSVSTKVSATEKYQGRREPLHGGSKTLPYERKYGC